MVYGRMPWNNNRMTDIVPAQIKKALPESPPYKGRLITESKKMRRRLRRRDDR